VDGKCIHILRVIQNSLVTTHAFFTTVVRSVTHTQLLLITYKHMLLIVKMLPFVLF